jgi:hypothetical protein
MKNIISIDIGIKTLSIYREEFDFEKAKKIKKIDRYKRYTKEAMATPEYYKYVEDVYKCGKVIYLDKKNISNNNNARFVDRIVLINLIDYLDELDSKGLFNDVDTIVIEKQMQRNPNAQIIEHHIYSYLLILFKSFKNIVIFPSKNKTRVLGAPLKVFDLKLNKWRKVKKHERKKWATDKTNEILNNRSDFETLDFIFKTNKTKKDDLSDTIVQCLAYNLLELDKCD